MTTKVYIDKVEDDSIWITGTAVHYKVTYDWYAKTEDEKNKNGIEKGRTVKLVIRKKESEDSEDLNEENFWKSVVANFDRGWVIQPKDSAATEVFYSVFDELEKIQIYKKRIYGGSTVKKVINKTKNMFNYDT